MIYYLNTFIATCFVWHLLKTTWLADEVAKGRGLNWFVLLIGIGQLAYLALIGLEVFPRPFEVFEPKFYLYAEVFAFVATLACLASGKVLKFRLRSIFLLPIAVLAYTSTFLGLFINVGQDLNMFTAQSSLKTFMVEEITETDIAQLAKQHLKVSDLEASLIGQEYDKVVYNYPGMQLYWISLGEEKRLLRVPKDNYHLVNKREEVSARVYTGLLGLTQIEYFSTGRPEAPFLKPCTSCLQFK